MIIHMQQNSKIVIFGDGEKIMEYFFMWMVPMHDKIF